MNIRESMELVEAIFKKSGSGPWPWNEHPPGYVSPEARNKLPKVRSKAEDDASFVGWKNPMHKTEEEAILAVAQQLGFKSLETQESREISTDAIKKALQDAYNWGLRHAPMGAGPDR